MSRKNANLLKLADALEGKMPKDFTWDFYEILSGDGYSCGTTGCAIGLGIITGIIKATPAEIICKNFTKPSCRDLGITETVYEAIFMDDNGALPKTKNMQVTPKTVAKAIRRYVATGEIPEARW